jgi:hypothetical protein
MLKKIVTAELKPGDLLITKEVNTNENTKEISKESKDDKEAEPNSSN